MSIVAFFWLFACGLLLLMLWPWRPSTPMQWALFLALGPLVYGAFEYLGGWILSPRLGARISPRRFSWLRIAYALAALLLFLVIFYVAMHLLGSAIAVNDA
jgi:hypothetical protein